MPVNWSPVPSMLMASHTFAVPAGAPSVPSNRNARCVALKARLPVRCHTPWSGAPVGPGVSRNSFVSISVPSFASLPCMKVNRTFSSKPSEARPFTALERADVPVSWSADNQAIFAVQVGLPVKVFKIDLASGRRELWKEITSPDSAGLLYLNLPTLTPDARGYGYTYFCVLSQVYLVENVK